MYGKCVVFTWCLPGKPQVFPWLKPGVPMEDRPKPRKLETAFPLVKAWKTGLHQVFPWGKPGIPALVERGKTGFP